jgi:signal transduction histidine kinase/ActR/RegA family two-component response regulator
VWTQRALGQVFLVTQAALAATLAVVLAVRHDVYALPLAIAALAYGACFWAFRRGWEPGRRNMVSAMTRLAAQAEKSEQARRQAESDRRDALCERARASRLEQAQRLDSVARLAGGVAHDLNNLLTVIGASSAMAERAIAAGESPAQDLNEVNLAVARATELTKQLTALSRKQVLVKRSIELNELVSNVERTLRRLIGDGTRLSARLCPQSLRVQADAAQLEQVIVNLVINARDAISGTGKIELLTERLALLPSDEIDIEQLASGDYACLEVRDDGSGMSQEVQRQLFEPFFTTKAAGRAAGLGLAASFGIVHQHEGTIRVESAPGKGTVMRILLPLAAGEATLTTSGVVALVERRRLLVVEDEPQVRAIAARALSNAGFDVQQAPNGAAALALVKSQTRPFDLIVTDVVMPEMNGPDLARAVIALQPDIALVFMSGYPEAMHEAGPDEFEGAAFLSKPFAPQQLIEVVRERVEQLALDRAAHA